MRPSVLNLPWFNLVSTRTRLIRWGIPLGLFLLALGVRLPALGQFLTRDEADWVDRSRHFLAGLIDPTYVCSSPANTAGIEQAQGLACTLRTGHPGVTTMWTGSLGIVLRYLADGSPGSLLDYSLAIQTDPLDLHFIVPVRLPTVLLTSLWVVIVYGLVWRLFARRAVALVAGLLLALDPFHIALSRVLHHDALATTFMTLSLLTALVYWGQRETRRWLVVSGMLAGLAFLSKSPAFFLNPFIALIGWWSLASRWARGETITWSHLTTIVVDGLLWFGCAVATFVALWPAMWSIPVDVLSTIFTLGNRYADEGHTHYFLGTVSDDPGPLFYPLTWLLRSSPLVWIGLAGIIIFWLLARPPNQGPASPTSPGFPPLLLLRRVDQAIQHRFVHDSVVASGEPYLPLLLLYALLFVALMTLSTKKQDRYILPIYPPLSIVAAVGLIQISNLKSIRLISSLAGRKFLILLAALTLLWQGSLVFSNYPYYFTYYNPLLGGAPTAEQLVTIGWGEGLDLAAAYLNQKPHAAQLKVTADYRQVFAPYFHGQAVGFFSVGEAMSSDYVVIYQNQLQRPDTAVDLLAYYRQHQTPEQTIRLQGVDYALIYAVPVERRTNWQVSNVFGKLILYGYSQIDAQPGLLTLRLVWESQGLSTTDGLWAALGPPPGQGDPAAEEVINWQSCGLGPGFSSTEIQQVGRLFESICQVNTTGLEPTIYTLHIGVGPVTNDQSAITSIVDLFAPAGELGISIDQDGKATLLTPSEALTGLAKQLLPPTALPLHVSYGDTIALIGYEIEPTLLQTEGVMTIKLYWRALQDLAQLPALVQNFQLRLGFIGPDGQLTIEQTDDLSNLAQAIEGWQPGQVVVDSHQVLLPDNLPAGAYRLGLALIRADTGEIVPSRDEATGQLMTDYLPLEPAIIRP